MTSRGARIAGWYGKIPALGDFASRGLPHDFMHAWDSWLQHSIAASRAHLGEQWLDLYLTSPIWRFTLMPGACGASAWAGVLMPSVDKVGRYFPLTIAAQIEPQSHTVAMAFSAQEWYEAVEQIALSMLALDASPAELEQGLADTPLPAACNVGDQAQQRGAQELAAWWQTGSSAPKTLLLPRLSILSSLIDATAYGVLAATGVGKTLWWTGAEESEAGQLHCFSGLPPEDYFTILLQGVAPDMAPT
jgi:type VI secretion system protein ImpM